MKKYIEFQNRIVSIDECALRRVENLNLQQNQVMIHMTYRAKENGDAIRIWRSTWLEEDTAEESASLYVPRIIHVENISFAPTWTRLRKNEVRKFTLIFTGLSKECSEFSIHEKPRSVIGSGLFVDGFKRNNTDVYQCSLNC